MQFLNFAIC
uniref:Uncharacterized protein n=1 Tax=Rhizophora mucronata TaxID=61149 RepID=A0A2P2PAR7_RHIMU